MTQEGSRREGTREQKGEASEDRNQEKWQQKGSRGTTGASARSEGHGKRVKCRFLLSEGG